MTRLLQLSLLSFLLCTFTPQSCVSTGSNTYLSNNGFPINFLENIVQSPIVQKKLKSRWKWEVWDVVPGTHAYQLYIFNITNPQDVEKGAKPDLQSLGPYYYKEHRYKFDVSINLDLTVNFERNYTYQFIPEKSNGSENDLINILNVPLIIFSTIASGFDAAAANAAVNSLTASGESLVKQGVKVGDFLYHGIDIPNYKKYLQLLGPSNDLVDEFATGRYGVLKLKNGHHEKPFVVDSGLTNQNNVGRIVEWNSRRNLTWWNGNQFCNEINGSDSSVFPPYLSPKTILQILDLDLCRSINFEYSNDMMFKGAVAGMTFNISKDVLADPKTFQPNMCFCKTPDTCLMQGVIDISNCRNGAPFVMSYPHFLDANPEYLQAVNGLHPNPNLHRTQIDVEPVTGAVINYRKRFQYNILLKPLGQLDFFRSHKFMIFPLFWNDDAFHLNPDKANLLVEELANQLAVFGVDTASDLLNRLNAQQMNGGSLPNKWHVSQILFFSCVVAKICTLIQF